MGAGRFFCVGFPFMLALGATVPLLTVALSGISHQKLHLFHVNTENISISLVNIENIGDKFFGTDVKARTGTKNNNITATDLHLAKTYDVNIFGFCWTELRSNDCRCSDGKFDWASNSLNTTTIEQFNPSNGISIKLPKELKTALVEFIRISKWTQVFIILALAALGVEIILGIFSTMSRIISCITWVLASAATVLVGVVASLATAQAAIVVGAVEVTKKWYGAHAHVNGGSLACVWFSFTCALAAVIFWFSTICCCKPKRIRRE